MMERELKYKISEEKAFKVLLKALPGFIRASRQTNFYFVGAEHPFKPGKTMIRVREESGSYKLTFKNKLKSVSGYFESIEVEEIISPEIFQLFYREDPEVWKLNLRPLQEAKGCTPEGRLRRAGFTITNRRHYRFPTNDFGCLDRTEYPDRSVDFELEIETEDPEMIRNYVRGVFEEIELTLESQTKTKYERCLTVLEKMSLHG